MLLSLTLAGFSDPALAEAGEGLYLPGAKGESWQPRFSAGFDAYVHSYSLATSDTSETLAEYLASAAVTGRSARSARHRWLLHGEASLGTELARENLEFRYRRQNEQRQSKWRLDGRLRGRQYRKSTEYSLSSDNSEGRLELRVYPWRSGSRSLDLRGFGGFMTYSKPSSLEVNYRDRGLGIFTSSGTLAGPAWSLGARHSGRVYPDSTRIDRRLSSLEGRFDTHDDRGQHLNVFHRTERRHIRDATVRPSGWTHWTDLNGALAAGTGQVFLEVQSEIWNYDQEYSAYFDSWRLKTTAGYSWGDILATTWQLGLTGEILAAGDNPEAYTEYGLRAGAEAYSSQLNGSLTLEVGQRLYADGSVDLGSGFGGDDFSGDEVFDLYTDFIYWEIWLTGNWRINENLSFDLLASFAPENHTEQDDDATLGFATVRLVYRP